MNDHEWKTTNEKDFESILESSVSDLPPKDVVAEVTPWKKAMNRILIGMTLSAITLNFWGLNWNSN